MKEETFDYSKVPYNFGLCTAETCPLAETCLRQITYQHAPASLNFLITLNLKTAGAMTEKCKSYCSNEKVRYAKGFVRTTEALAVSVSGTFRYRLIGHWGIRRYYQKRKGETLLLPAEQRQIVALAKELGVHQEEYFDGYVEEYKWG